MVAEKDQNYYDRIENALNAVLDLAAGWLEEAEAARKVADTIPEESRPIILNPARATFHKGRAIIETINTELKRDA